MSLVLSKERYDRIIKIPSVFILAADNQYFVNRKTHIAMNRAWSCLLYYYSEFSLFHEIIKNTNSFQKAIKVVAFQQFSFFILSSCNR